MTRDEYLSSRQPVPLSVGDTTMFVRPWGGRQRLEFDVDIGARQENGKVDTDYAQALAFCLSVVDAAGGNLFSKDDAENVQQNVKAAFLDAVWEWAVIENGLLKQGREEQVKN